MAESDKHEPRVAAYFPKVQDFERNEDGSVRADSLLGPNRIEARQQKARERLVLGSEIKVLQDELRWCYIKSGVNHYEDCKSIVDKVVTRLASHNKGIYRMPAKAAAAE